MNIWKKKASDLTVEEITLLSLGLGVGVGAITYVYKETDWFETVRRKFLNYGIRSQRNSVLEKESAKALFFLREIYICSNGNNNKIKEILL